MAADEITCLSPSSDMPSDTTHGSAGHTRRILAAIAFVTFGFIWFWVLAILFACGPAVVVSFFRFSLFLIVPLVGLNALVTAEIVVDLFCFGTHRSRCWSDKRHFITVLIIWIVFFGGQLSFALLARQQLLGG